MFRPGTDTGALDHSPSVLLGGANSHGQQPCHLGSGHTCACSYVRRCHGRRPGCDQRRRCKCPQCRLGRLEHTFEQHGLHGVTATVWKNTRTHLIQYGTMSVANTLTVGFDVVNTAIVGDAPPQTAADPYPPQQFVPGGQSNQMITGSSNALKQTAEVYASWSVWQCGSPIDTQGVYFGDYDNFGADVPLGTTALTPGVRTGRVKVRPFNQWVAYFAQFVPNPSAITLTQIVVSLQDVDGNLLPFNLNDPPDDDNWNVYGSSIGPTDRSWNSSPPYKAVMFQYNPDFSRGLEAWLSPTLPFLKVVCTDGRTSQMTFNGVGNGALQLLQATPSASDDLPTTSAACASN